MARLQSIKLLILDDIGLKTYILEESRGLLEIAESRYNKTSIRLYFQIKLSISKWYKLFPDPTITDAIMDRIIYNNPGTEFEEVDAGGHGKKDNEDRWIGLY